MHLVEDFKNEGLNRGYAFLYFPSHSDALDACRLLQRRNAVFGINRTAKVTFADAFNEPVEIMEQVCYTNLHLICALGVHVAFIA